MKQLVLKLWGLITRQTALYEELLDLSRKKKDVIVKNNTSELNAIIMDEKSVLREIGRLDTEREKLFYSFSEVTGIKEPHISDIVVKAGEDVRKDMEGLLSKLEGTVLELRRLNVLNRTLIETHLEYSNFCINLITGQQETMNVYSGSGRLDEKNKANLGLLDQTI